MDKPMAMTAFSRWEEVPIFDSEEAEAGFWAENKPDVRLMESAVAGNGDPGGVVAPVFQAPQPLENDRNRLLVSDVADYSTHIAVGLIVEALLRIIFSLP